MGILDIDLFVQTGIDYEIRQYRILDSLKQVQREFSRNRLYPYLSDLIDASRSLESLLSGIHKIDTEMPKQIKEIDLLNQRITYELLNNGDEHLKTVKDIISWALPLIKEAIKEGITIYEFVNENIEVRKVGIEPSYTESGYLFVPDNGDQKLHIFMYELSIITGANDRYRSLKTVYLKSIDESGLKYPVNSIKLELIRENSEFPNPATYNLDTDLDFPFEDTIFPISKRKFIRYLSS